MGGLGGLSGRRDPMSEGTLGFWCVEALESGCEDLSMNARSQKPLLTHSRRLGHYSVPWATGGMSLQGTGGDLGFVKPGSGGVWVSVSSRWLHLHIQRLRYQ